jgi:hypothetical protein
MFPPQRFDRRIDKKRSPHKVYRESSHSRSPHNRPPEETRGKDKPRIAVNTIAGGFAGGGNFNAARKRYVRKFERESNVVGLVSFPLAPDMSFSPKMLQISSHMMTILWSSKYKSTATSGEY